MPFASANGIRLHYEVAGEGERPIVFAHGGAADASQWRSQMEFFCCGFRAIAYDARGHGWSEAPEGEYSVDILTEDLFGLLRALGIERCTIVGLSLGGVVAMNTALRHPASVASLVLVSTTAEVDEEMQRNFEESARIALETGMEAFAEGFCAVVFSERFKRERPGSVEFYRKRIAATSPRGYASAIRALARQPSLLRELRAIAVPTLVMAGEIETLPRTQERARRICDAIAGAELALIPEAGYMANVEQPERFNAVVSTFLACA